MTDSAGEPARGPVNRDRCVRSGAGPARPIALFAATVLVGAVLAGLIARTPPSAGFNGGSPRPVWFVGGAWLAFIVGVWLVRRLPARAAVAVILVGGATLPLSAAFAPPRSSDDLYRYIWDGRVQAAGENPYRHAPASADLVDLRDGYLWPEHSDWCVTGGTDVGTGRPLAPGCTLINRPSVPTIYPPVGEAYFYAVHLLSPSGGRYVPHQLAASALAVVTTMLLLVGLRRLGADPRSAVWWAWCPTVAYEAGSNAHVDVLAATLSAAALVCLVAGTRRAVTIGAVLLGLAIATKLTPALLLPAVLRRRPAVVVTAVAGTVAAAYLPHLLTVGTAVIGYLPGYVTEEGYRDGSGFSLLSPFVPRGWTGLAAVAILCVVALVMTRTADPDRPWHAAATMTGTALVVAATDYPWYALLLVVLVAFGARPEWLAVAGAGYLAHYANHLDLAYTIAQRLGYGTAIAAVALGWLFRRRAAGDRPARSAPVAPAVTGSRPPRLRPPAGLRPWTVWARAVRGPRSSCVERGQHVAGSADVDSHTM